MSCLAFLAGLDSVAAANGHRFFNFTKTVQDPIYVEQRQYFLLSSLHAFPANFAAVVCFDFANSIHDLSLAGT